MTIIVVTETIGIPEGVILKEEAKTTVDIRTGLQLQFFRNSSSIQAMR